MSFQTRALAFALRACTGTRPSDAPMQDDETRAVSDEASRDRALDLFATRALASWNDADQADAARATSATSVTSVTSAIGTMGTMGAAANASMQVDARASGAPGDAAPPPSLQSRASLVFALYTATAERDLRRREYQAAMQALDEIQTSCGWRLVLVARGLIVDLLPAGTRRRRLFHAALSRFTTRLTRLRPRRGDDLPSA
jgi:hypothetical protein